MSAELSDLKFVEVNVDKSNDDCLDFESGEYVFKNLNLSNCMDKGFQIKKSFVNIENLTIEKSDYGMSIHDSSLVSGKNIFIDTNKECLSIYRENDSYYGSMMNITDGSYVKMIKIFCMMDQF